MWKQRSHCVPIDGSVVVANKTFILSVRELIALIECSLEPFMGPAASVANHIPMIDLIFSEYCAVELPDDHRAVRTMLLNYGIPSDVAAEVESDVRAGIYRQLTKICGEWSELLEYTYDIYSSNYITLTVILRKQPTLAEIMAAEVVEGIEEGNWYPERLRRSLGVA